MQCIGVFIWKNVVIPTKNSMVSGNSLRIGLSLSNIVEFWLKQSKICKRTKEKRRGSHVSKTQCIVI